MEKEPKKRKEELEDGDINLDNLDSEFGDFDFDGGLDIDDLKEGTDDIQSRTPINIATQLAKETAAGFYGSIGEKTLKKVLPSSYSESYYELVDYKDFLKDELEKNRLKIQKSLLSLTKETRKILPFKLGILDKIVEKLQTDQETYEQQSKEQFQESAIQSTLSSIFDRQLEATKEIESVRQADEEARFKTELSISKVQSNILREISNNISSQTSFTLNIAKEYYRKSLELQLRSFYIQSDLLNITKEYFKGFSVQFDSIINFVKLPDFLKLRNIENFREIMREEFNRNIYENVFANNKYIEKLKKKISSAISNKVSDITYAIDEITSTMSMLTSTAMDDDPDSKMSILTSFLGTIIGDTLAEKASNKLKEKFASNVQEKSYIKTGSYLLESLLKSPETLFTFLQKKAKKYVDENSESESITGSLLSKILSPIANAEGLFSSDRINTEVNSRRKIFNISSPAVFDNRVYTSITDVIPGYLSKIFIETKFSNDILQKAFKTKLGSSSLKRDEELVYNYITGKFTTLEQYKKDIQKDVFQGKDSESIKRKGEKISREIVKAVNEGKDVKERLNERTTTKELTNLLLALKERYKSKFDVTDLLKTEKIDEFRKEAELNKYFTNNVNKLLEEMNKSEKEKIEKIEKNLEYQSADFKDVGHGYPIETIKKVFSTISTLLKNTLTMPSIILDDEEAVIIGKALSNFIFKTSRIIDMDNISNGRAFSFLPADTDKELLDKISLFIYYVNKARKRDNEVQFKCIALLSTLNESIRSSLNIDLKVFKDLSDINRELVPKYLFAENITEGTLENLENKYKENIIDPSVLVEMSRKKSEKVKEIEGENQEKTFEKLMEQANKIANKNSTFIPTDVIKKATDKFSEFKENLKNPRSLAKFVVETVSEVKNAVSKSIGKKYNNAVKQIDNFASNIGNYTVEKFKAGLSSVTKTIDNLKKDIENAHKTNIETLEKTREELLNLLPTVTDEEKELASNSLISINRAIEKENKIYETKIKAMEKIKNKFEEINKSAESIKAEDTSILSTLKDKFIEAKKTLDEIIKEYKQVEQTAT